jgi:hypothetical protein
VQAVRQPGPSGFGVEPRANLRTARFNIERELGGYVNATGGNDRLIVEFDDNRAARLKANSATKDRFGRQVFEDVVLQMRDALDIRARSTRQSSFLSAVNDSPDSARDALTSFIKELFENAYQHGRLSDSRGAYVPNLRFMRFRKIYRNNSALFTSAFASMAVLRDFVQSHLRRRGDQAFLEISVSDFGAGILGTFLASPAGKRHLDRPREKVLDELLYDRLTSTPLDRSAGLGIRKALRAAQSQGAFVSMRTNEFWRAQSFARPMSEPILRDVVAGHRLGHVAGTHWTIIWAAP